MPGLRRGRAGRTRRRRRAVPRAGRRGRPALDRADRGRVAAICRGLDGMAAGHRARGGAAARRSGWTGWRPGWPTGCGCSPAAVGSTTGTARCARPWTGATPCSTSRSGPCCAGCRSSPGRSPRPPRRPSLAGWPPVPDGAVAAILAALADQSLLVPIAGRGRHPLPGPGDHPSVRRRAAPRHRGAGRGSVPARPVVRGPQRRARPRPPPRRSGLAVAFDLVRRRAAGAAGLGRRRSRAAPDPAYRSGTSSLRKSDETWISTGRTVSEQHGRYDLGRWLSCPTRASTSASRAVAAIVAGSLPFPGTCPFPAPVPGADPRGRLRGTTDA